MSVRNAGEAEHFRRIYPLVGQIMDGKQGPHIFEKGAGAVVDAYKARYERCMGIMAMYDVRRSFQLTEKLKA